MKNTFYVIYHSTLSNIYSSINEIEDTIPGITIRTIEDDDLLTIDIKAPSVLGFIHYEYCFNAERNIVARAVYIDGFDDDIARSECSLEEYCNISYDVGRVGLDTVLSVYRRASRLVSAAEYGVEL